MVESRTSRSPIVLEYIDYVAQLFLTGGVSADLAHHSMHAIGSRVRGFTQDVFDSREPGPVTIDPAVFPELAAQFPSLAIVAGAVSHDLPSVVGVGCDDQFEFALDVLLNGIERLHDSNWTSKPDGSSATNRSATTA